jgi:hypothetical protein
MAFTLQVKQQKRFWNKAQLDISSLADACGFQYGSNNEFYILQGGETQNGTAILYNPERIGRGIFFDGTKAKEGFYELSYNIPTTRWEIGDFVRLVREIERCLGKVEMYCVEEERNYTSDELEERIDLFAEYGLESLKKFCRNKEYSSYILSLALFPYTIPEEKVAQWENSEDLSDFEQTLHCLQAQDVYYAKPLLLRNNTTQKIGAFYALTEGCASVLPLHADGFLNLDDIKVDEGFVRFVSVSEQRILEGTFPYEAFMEELTHLGVERFDGGHVLIPPMSREELDRLSEKLSAPNE